MKKLNVVTKISIVLFIVFVALAIALTKPLYNRLKGATDDYIIKMIEKVSDATGLYISYEDFSPSILRGIRVENIYLKDEAGDTVLKIKTTKIDYKLIEIIKGNYQDFVRSITIDGVEIYVEKIAEVVSPYVKIDENFQFDINSITEFFPATVSVKNVILKYEAEDISIETIVKKISLHAGKNRKNFDFQMDTSLSVEIKNLSKKITAGLKADGTIYNSLDNSSIHLTVSDLTDGTYKLNKTNLLMSYNVNCFDVHTIQSTYPFYAGAVFDLKKQLLSAEIKMDNLNPMAVVSTHVSNDVTKMLNRFRLTMNTGAMFNVKTNNLSYYSAGSLTLPEQLLEGGADVEYKLSGDETQITVHNLAINGKMLSASLDLDCVYKNLQINGACYLEKFLLPNGKSISADIYFDPLQSGFRIFSPEIAVGNKSLTAANINIHPGNDSIDFEVEVSDYSKQDSTLPGKINIDGSFLISSKYVQTSISLASIYISSIMDLISEAADDSFKQSMAQYSSYIEPYMFSCDAYLSTDFNSVLYNVTNLVLADTSVNNRLLFLSLNGNEASIQINHLDVIYNKFAAQMEMSAALDYDSKEVFFTTDVTTGSVPYNLVGTINPEIIKLNGNYGFDAEVRISSKKDFEGYLNIGNLPFVLGDYVMIVSAETDFNYTKEFGPVVNINRFELEETDSRNTLNPRLVVSGNVTQYGSQFNSISYTDANSSLQGNCDINLNLFEGNFDSAGINMKLKNDTSGEEITVEGSLSNPDGVTFNLENVMNSLYVSVLTQINHFSLNRFTSIKNSNNEISAVLSLSGPLAHPFATVNISELTFLFGDQLMHAKGSATLEDRFITINNFDIDFPGWMITDFTGNISIEDVTGQLNCSFIMGDNAVVVPISLNLHDSYIPQGQMFPESMVANLSCRNIHGTTLKSPVDFDITFMYMPDELDFYSSQNLGLYGNFNMKSGDLYASLKAGDAVSGECIGYMRNGDVNLAFTNIFGDIKKLSANTEFNGAVQIEDGIVEGNFILGGNLDIPEFGGEITISRLNVKLPSVFEQNLKSDKITIAASQNDIFLRESFFKFKNNVNNFMISASLSFNKWTVDQMQFNFVTLADQVLPLRIVNPLINFSGDIVCNLEMLLNGNNVILKGKASGEKIDIVSSLQDITASANNGVSKSASSASPLDINIAADLELLLGTHVMLNFNPILRCIFVPNTKLRVKMDSQTNLFQIDGQLNLKSGDVAYLNRSFYLKEGKIKFNPDEPLNPQVTLRAETRERDDEGQNVKIILSAENQYLTDFNPTFSSIPAKSENEIRQLLGQIIMADTDNIGQLLGTAGNYYLQSTLIRGIENKLRDLLNFDIFSVRTNVLQNAVNLGVSGNINNNNISVGNFLDNSTVYIGKYLGSVLYVDAMLHLSAEDSSIPDISAPTGLLFQPEIGMELDLPVANIRWSMAPDINALINHQYVPSASLSLSWKFSF